MPALAPVRSPWRVDPQRTPSGSARGGVMANTTPTGGGHASYPGFVYMIGVPNAGKTGRWRALTRGKCRSESSCRPGLPPDRRRPAPAADPPRLPPSPGRRRARQSGQEVAGLAALGHQDLERVLLMVLTASLVRIKLQPK